MNSIAAMPGQRAAMAVALVVTLTAPMVLSSAVPAAPRYLQLPARQLLALPAQDWEGGQQPHTFSVLEMKRGGFRYWAWYALNNSRGVGLARSNDLVHWTKFAGNPLWLNARWPSAL